MIRLRARRLGVRVAYRLISVWWFLARPHTQGVKVLLLRGPDALFVRHTYGPKVWELPGGGRRRGVP